MFIKKQVGFGPRVPNSAAHQLCGNYLIEKFENYGAEVIVQNFTKNSFDGKTLQLRNIIATYNTQAKKRILIAAHWDTRPFADKDTVDFYNPIDGANDGASGVAVLLEIARKLRISELPNVGVDIILFDGEDYGEYPGANAPNMIDGRLQIWWCLGSQYWSRNLHKTKYSAYYGILLDMVGAKNARFHKEGGAMQFAPKVVNKIWTTGRHLGYGNYFINANSPGITDDHIFVNTIAKIPMINIVDHDQYSTNYYFPDYHHTHQDNLELIDKQTLQAVGETLLYILYHE
jgi:Zn-dependent M28 family amino/carboxypeptidase